LLAVFLHQDVAELGGQGGLADAGHADDRDQLGVAGGVHQLGDVLGDPLKLPVVDLKSLNQRLRNSALSKSMPS
jgi:hypothetical protein